MTTDAALRKHRWIVTFIEMSYLCLCGSYNFGKYDHSHQMDMYLQWFIVVKEVLSFNVYDQKSSEKMSDGMD